MCRKKTIVLCLAVSSFLSTQVVAQEVDRAIELKKHTPKGIYVLNEDSDEQSAATAYATGMTTSPAYENVIDGHAIYLPLAQILPSVTTWGQFNWNWTYLDTLVQVAVANNKKFSIEMGVGYQSGSTYLQSLPMGFESACGTDCAALFDVWTVGGPSGRCISAFVPFPWNKNVREMWQAAARALSEHLHQTGVYDSLTMLHVPGLSIYDEELRLPTGFPAPPTGSTAVCPDGRTAIPAVADDASVSRWEDLGYSDTAVITGFGKIAHAFANVFPDPFLALSLLNPGTIGLDFPNLTGTDPVGYVASQLVKKVTDIAPGRVQLQSDDLDTNFVLQEVIDYASDYSTFIGWQTNKRDGSGAACNGLPCVDLGTTGTPYFDIIQEGAQNSGRYLEVWSHDVVSYPNSFATTKADGYFPSR